VAPEFGAGAKLPSGAAPGAPVDVLVEGAVMAALLAELVMGKLSNADIVSIRYCGAWMAML
jgi:hypothetical protein